MFRTRIYIATFIITLITVIVTLNVVPPNVAFGGSVDAEKACKDGGPDKYENIAKKFDPVDELVDCYHESVNETFNKNVSELVKLTLQAAGSRDAGNVDDAAKVNAENRAKSEEALKKLVDRISPVSADENGNRSCSTDTKNLSTYCLSENLVIEFSKFRAGMMSARNKLKVEAGEEAARIQTLEARGSDGDSNNTNDNPEKSRMKLFKSFGEKINRIDQEILIAQKALDQSLEAYNELQFALPLHLKYQQTIKVLNGDDGYIEKLSDIRRRVELYPISFVDVTTPACN